MTIQVTVPDVGEAGEVEVIEVLVAVGDIVAKDDSLVVLESDKASMEIPSPYAGKVVNIAVKEGDSVEEGSLIVELDVEGESESESESEAKAKAEAADKTQENDRPAPSEPKEPIAATAPSKAVEEQAAEVSSSETIDQLVVVPDVGDAGEVTVTELLVKLGDVVEADDSILVLESDKASMEIPSPFGGEVIEILVEDGAVVTEGDPLVKLRTTQRTQQKTSPQTPTHQAVKGAAAEPVVEEKNLTPVVETSSPQSPSQESVGEVANEKIHAGPAVRKQAREYGVNLSQVTGTGQKDRVLKEDVQAFIKAQLKTREGSAAGQVPAGGGIPPIPSIDFSKFGEIELRPLSRVRRSSARNLHRSWLNVAHVTQFDEADITDLEVFRKSQNLELASAGDKLTPLAFLIKACVHALIKYPQFNSSIDVDYEYLTLKKYYNIGIAVETPDGLVVPVVRDADKKGVVELARESAKLAGQARDKKLPLDAMQGATFTISSLGGIGGTAFTPIVNAPEVAILGVSRASMGPVWDGQAFAPRMLLPLSLSYDHRAIDGAEAARFANYLTQVLGDVRRLIL